MRKYQREIIRRHAWRLDVKPSRYVNSMWDRIQRKKVGAEARLINKQHGAKPKRKWLHHVHL